MLSTFRLSKPSKQAKPKSLWNVKTSPDAERNTTHLVQEENRCCDVWTESSYCCRNKQQYGRLNVRNGTDGCCRNSWRRPQTPVIGLELHDCNAFVALRTSLGPC